MIGVNTYGLTQMIEEDMPGTFRAVKEAGFEAVELLVVPVKKHRWETVRNNKRRRFAMNIEPILSQLTLEEKASLCSLVTYGVMTFKQLDGLIASLNQ